MSNDLRDFSPDISRGGADDRGGFCGKREARGAAMVVPLGRQATWRLPQKSREGRASAKWPRMVCHRVESCRNAGVVMVDDANLRDLMKCPG
jgi:hypothetical protein